MSLFDWIDNWRQNRADRQFWRARAKCDSCDGTYRRDQLHPRSGDWWMCDRCYDKFLAQWADDLVEFNEKGKL